MYAKLARDYGPGSAFWLFACERLNGILHSVPTNYRGIEPQLMKKFITGQQVSRSTESNTESEVNDILNSFRSAKGWLKHESLPEMPCPSVMSLANLEYVNSLFLLSIYQMMNLLLLNIP